MEENTIEQSVSSLEISFFIYCDVVYYIPRVYSAPYINILQFDI